MIDLQYIFTPKIPNKFAAITVPKGTAVLNIPIATPMFVLSKNMVTSKGAKTTKAVAPMPAINLFINNIEKDPAIEKATNPIIIINNAISIIDFLLYLLARKAIKNGMKIPGIAYAPIQHASLKIRKGYILLNFIKYGW